EANRLPVLQPERLRDAAFQGALGALAPDVAVVAAYGKIPPRAVLDLPPRGCINVHASLLPRHRGAAPIAWAVLAGDAVTGVTIMAMTEEMDAGDILLQRETAIAPDDTGGTLGDRLARLGAKPIGEAIDGLQAGTLRPVPQPAAGVTFAPRIEREHRRLAWRAPAGARERRRPRPSPSSGAPTGWRARRCPPPIAPSPHASSTEHSPGRAASTAIERRSCACRSRTSTLGSGRRSGSGSTSSSSWTASRPTPRWTRAWAWRAPLGARAPPAW